MLTVRELLEREDFSDADVLHHGFVDYMRDYELLVGARDGPPHTDLHRYLFVGCTEALCETTLPPAVLVESLGDASVEAGPDAADRDVPAGFLWGVRWAAAYPGWTYVTGGEPHTGRHASAGRCTSSWWRQTSIRSVLSSRTCATLGSGQTSRSSCCPARRIRYREWTLLPTGMWVSISKPLSNVALQLTADSKELRRLAALAGAYYYGSAAAELWR